MAGGSGGTENIPITYGSALPAITVPIREGYAFEGYYDDVNGTGTRYYDGSGMALTTWDKASSATLYANWTVTS
jgi:hypothetical protein